MKTTVIDALEAITILHNAGSTPELAAISGENQDGDNEALDGLEQLLASLSMDDETSGKLLDAGCSIFTHGEEYGFRRGFRVATRLMMESLVVQDQRDTKEVSHGHKNLNLMDSILDAITETDEWRDLQMRDPMAAAARNRLEAALEQVKPLIPVELYIELSDIYTAGIVAAGYSGILFGIHVADAIRDVASRPADLSRHILKRMEGDAV